MRYRSVFTGFSISLPSNDLIKVLKFLGANPETVAKAEGVGLPLLPHINVLVDLVRHLKYKSMTRNFSICLQKCANTAG